MNTNTSDIKPHLKRNYECRSVKEALQQEEVVHPTGKEKKTAIASNSSPLPFIILTVQYLSTPHNKQSAFLF